MLGVKSHFTVLMASYWWIKLLFSEIASLGESEKERTSHWLVPFKQLEILSSNVYYEYMSGNISEETKFSQSSAETSEFPQSSAETFEFLQWSADTSSWSILMTTSLSAGNLFITHPAQSIPSLMLLQNPQTQRWPCLSQRYLAWPCPEWALNRN